MATYVNNLRLKEIATGAESGTWGTSTNTNLELIADAFGSGTEGITTNADTHTTTIADGAADEGRAIYMKYTGTLDSACTITMAPNTVNKFWIVENATSGSQNIIISQGSGANITIGNGKVAAIFTDGAGSGAAVLDAFADLELSSSLTVAGAVDIDGAVQIDSTITVGVDDTGYDVKFFGDTASAYMLWDTSTDDLVLAGAAGIDLAGDLDVDGTANLDIVDIDGAVDMASTLAVTGASTLTGAVTAAAGITMTGTTPTLTIGDAGAEDTKILFDGNAQDFHIGLDDSVDDLLIGLGSTLGTTPAIRINEDRMVHCERGLTVQGGVGSVFNEDSADCDFRVESNGNANMFFVDGGADRIGIGTGTPSVTVDIQGQPSVDISNTADHANGGILNFRNTRTGQDNDEGGRIYFYTDDDAGNPFECGLVISQMTDASNGSEDSKLLFYTKENGSSYSTEFAGRNVSINPLGKLYLDGGGDTYISEYSGNAVGHYAGGTKALDVAAATVTVAGDLVVSGTGPHAIGGSAIGRVRFLLDGSFTSDGSSNTAECLRVQGAFTGASGDTQHLAGAWFVSSITTQAVSETITTVAQVIINEPEITVGSGATVTNSASLYISGAATEATNDYALWVDAGVSRFDENITLTATKKFYIDGGSDTYITEQSANYIGFYCADALAAFAAQGGFVLPATNKLWLDGGGTTYITEISDGRVGIYANNTLGLDIQASNMSIPAANEFYLDGGNNTYIRENSADHIEMVTNGNSTFNLKQGASNSFGGAKAGDTGLTLHTGFTSDGSDSVAIGAMFTGTTTGASGDTSYMSGTFFDNAITTQSATESIGHISQVRIAEPNITDNLTGDITVASSLMIVAAPTEGEQNWSLMVDDGSSRFDGHIVVGPNAGDAPAVGYNSVTYPLTVAYTGSSAQGASFYDKTTDTSSRYAIWFKRYVSSSWTTVGSISTSNSATSYNTSSDYRMKENETPLVDAIDLLNQLKPYEFNFKNDPDTLRQGFFAHEVAEVVPQAVTGEKDEVDDDGEPLMQGMDHSHMVPLLVAAIQELTAKVEALENG